MVTIQIQLWWRHELEWVLFYQNSSCSAEYTYWAWGNFYRSCVSVIIIKSLPLSSYCNIVHIHRLIGVSYTSTSDYWVAVHIDFTSVFTRTCQSLDYYNWIVSDGVSCIDHYGFSLPIASYYNIFVKELTLLLYFSNY